MSSDTLESIFNKGKKGKAVEPDDGKETDTSKKPEAQPSISTPPSSVSADLIEPKKRGRKPGKAKGTASYVSVLHECESVANKRQNQYGDINDMFESVSAICKTVFDLELSPESVCKVQIAFKWARQKNKKNRENLVDATNYTAILTKLQDE